MKPKELYRNNRFSVVLSLKNRFAIRYEYPEKEHEDDFYTYYSKDKDGIIDLCDDWCYWTGIASDKKVLKQLLTELL